MLATRDCTQLALLPPYSNMKGKKATRIFKNLSTKLPKPAPLKKRHLFFAFLLRWSAVADSGVIFSALSSTPVPHGFEAKSKHRAENFLLLLYRNIQSQKVNTASKSFLKSPLFLYRNIERKIFNINFKNAANAPHSLTATSEAKNDIDFRKFSEKSQISGVSQLKAQKERLPLFRSRRSFGIIQFLLHQPDQQLVHVLCRLAAGQQLVPKGQHHARQQPALIGA